jgi:hypothetical protein
VRARAAVRRALAQFSGRKVLMRRRDNCGGAVACETLENRRLLSGNVTAVFDGTTLIIKGDNKSNQIEIFGSGTPGYNIATSGGTTVNGQSGTVDDPVFIATGGIVPISIDMGNGDDEVRVSSVFTKDLSIATGNGDDLVVLSGVGVTGNLDVNTGNGDDTVDIGGLSVFASGSAHFNGGHGFDSLTNASRVRATGGSSFDNIESLSA